MPINLAQKDPADVVDYEIELTGPGLGADTIESVTQTANGITVNEITNTDTAVKVWVSGGVAGVPGKVLLTITTVGERVFERTLVIPVFDQ